MGGVGPSSPTASLLALGRTQRLRFAELSHLKGKWPSGATAARTQFPFSNGNRTAGVPVRPRPGSSLGPGGGHRRGWSQTWGVGGPSNLETCSRPRDCTGKVSSRRHPGRDSRPPRARPGRCRDQSSGSGGRRGGSEADLPKEGLKLASGAIGFPGELVGLRVRNEAGLSAWT